MSLNVITVKLLCRKIDVNSGIQRGGFQFMLILDLWCICFHTVVVFGLGKELLFKSVLGHCAKLESNMNRSMNTVITTDLFITDNFSRHLTLAFKRGTPFPRLAFFLTF